MYFMTIKKQFINIVCFIFCSIILQTLLPHPVFWYSHNLGVCNISAYIYFFYNIAYVRVLWATERNSDVPVVGIWKRKCFNRAINTLLFQQYEVFIAVPQMNSSLWGPGAKLGFVGIAVPFHFQHFQRSFDSFSISTSMPVQSKQY